MSSTGRPTLPVYVLLVDLDSMTVYWRGDHGAGAADRPEGRCLYPGTAWANVLATAGSLGGSRRAVRVDRRRGLPGQPRPPRSLNCRHPQRAGGHAPRAMRPCCARTWRGSRHAPELTARTLLVQHAAVASGPGSGRLRCAGRLRPFARRGRPRGRSPPGRSRPLPPPASSASLSAVSMLLLNSDRDQARELLEPAQAMSTRLQRPRRDRLHDPRASCCKRRADPDLSRARQPSDWRR